MKHTDALPLILRSIVQDPTKLDIQAQTAGSSTLYTVRTSLRDDHRRLVGRQGHNVQALRTLTAAMAQPGAPCRLHLEEPGHTPTAAGAKGAQDPEELLRAIVAACPVLNAAKVDVVKSADALTWNLALIPAAEIAPALNEALATIFRAVGKRQDLSLYLDIQPRELAPA